MSRTRTVFLSGLRRITILCAAVAVIGVLATASGQYQSGYPYARQQPAPRRVTNAELIGGFGSNPYKNNRTPPTGLPVSGNRHSYFGGGSPGGSLGYSKPKPFSNLKTAQPLVTSRDVARAEIFNGLGWGYGSGL